MPFGVLELPQTYNTRRFDFMVPVGPHWPITQSYVIVPPALHITDNEGARWTLGFDYSDTEWRTGKWEYDILRNGRVTGEFGRTIEFRRGRVIIDGADGCRIWNGRCFV